jgi:glycosyltransferase involved in cell wall biosynthesis
MNACTSVCVVIPTLNEEAVLPNVLASLASQTIPAERILIADAGSSDATCSIARAASVDVYQPVSRGRGNQIAEALSVVEEEVVLVGHADMVFPRTVIARIREALDASPKSCGGCLGHRFDRRTASLRLIEWGDWIRARFVGVSYGDQGQFFRRPWIEEQGGFPAQPLMEDLELARMLRRANPIYLGIPVVVSARRFERLGCWRTVWRNALLRRAYRREGAASCGELYRRYYSQDSAAT